MRKAYILLVLSSLLMVTSCEKQSSTENVQIIPKGTVDTLDNEDTTEFNPRDSIIIVNNRILDIQDKENKISNKPLSHQPDVTDEFEENPIIADDGISPTIDDLDLLRSECDNVTAMETTKQLLTWIEFPNQYEVSVISSAKGVEPCDSCNYAFIEDPTSNVLVDDSYTVTLMTLTYSKPILCKLYIDVPMCSIIGVSQVIELNSEYQEVLLYKNQIYDYIDLENELILANKQIGYTDVAYDLATIRLIY